MEASEFIAGVLVAAGAMTAAGLFSLHRSWQRRMQAFHRELDRMAQDVLQVAGLQLEAYRKISRELSGMEERLLDLTAPSQDPSLPLERRYQVLRLSGKGLSSREISERLGMPGGEVELILNLKKFLDPALAGTIRGSGAAGLRAPRAQPVAEVTAHLT